MLTFQLAIFTVLMHLPVHALDKTEPDRDARMLANAESIATAAERIRIPDKYMMAGYLIEQGRADSAWRYDVQIGQCRDNECDPYPCTIAGEQAVCHAAKGPWQLHCTQAMSSEQCDALTSSDPIDMQYAALHAAKLAAFYYTKCGGSVGVYNGFAYGRCLPFEGAEVRAKRARMYADKLRRLTKP